LVKHRSDTLTRDPTRPDPVKIADPVTRDPVPSLDRVAWYVGLYSIRRFV